MIGFGGESRISRLENEKQTEQNRVNTFSHQVGSIRSAGMRRELAAAGNAGRAGFARIFVLVLVVVLENEPTNNEKTKL